MITDQQAARKDLHLMSGELKLASYGLQEVSHMQASSSGYRTLDSEERSARTKA